MLSLLDILFPDATMKLVKAITPMNFTQPKLNLSDLKEILQRVGRLDNLERCPMDKQWPRFLQYSKRM